MNIEYMKSDEFQEIYSEKEYWKLAAIEGLDPAIKEQFREQMEMAKTIRDIQIDTGRQFRLAFDGQVPDAAAFVDPTTSDMYITFETLKDRRFALHAARHEKGHVDSGIYDFQLDSFLEKEQIESLEGELNCSGLTDLNWVEALNEAKTFKSYGSHEKSGYAQKEVPVAQKLENLCQQKLGKSALDQFAAGNKESLQKLFEELIGKLEIEKIIGDQKSQIANVTNNNTASLTEQEYSLAA